MIKKLMLLVIAICLASCGSKQTVVRTHKPVKKTTQVARRGTAAKKPYRKPAPGNRTVTVNKPLNRNGSNNPELKKIEQEYEAAKESGKSTGNSTVYSKEEILEATTRVKVTTAMVLDYINTYKGIAQNNMSQYGIPASIIIGQGILESGAGTGPLSVLANNHFGIKCHKEWNGPSVLYDDDAAGECFRQYADPGESYRDHSLFLTSRSRYASLFELDPDDYRRWAKGLKAAGYATDPKYPDKLIGIIERYQLQKYDAEVMGGGPFVAEEEVVASNTPGPGNYEVIKGDTLYSISKRFNISVDELRRKNNLQDNAISIGQYLKVN